jgi:uncharacterized protein
MRHVDRLLAWLPAEPEYVTLLGALGQILPGRSSIGAGCLAGLVWNRLTGRPVRYGVKDIDVATFDPDDLTEDGERRLEVELRAACPELRIRLDVKNQARVHLWYECRFGHPIASYRSLETAVATWPTTATAVAVIPDPGDLRVVAPFGLDDLFAMTARPNRAQVTRAVYEAKTSRWRRVWPEIRVEPW